MVVWSDAGHRKRGFMQQIAVLAERRMRNWPQTRQRIGGRHTKHVMEQLESLPGFMPRWTDCNKYLQYITHYARF